MSGADAQAVGGGDWRSLGRWAIESRPGNEREAIACARDALRNVSLAHNRFEALMTAVGEATMNAMEHGNGYQPDVPVQVEAFLANHAVMVRITDQGGPFTLTETDAPNLEAKLSGLQSPRGWGLFLIERLVDEARVINEGAEHAIALIMRLDGQSS